MECDTQQERGLLALEGLSLALEGLSLSLEGLKGSGPSLVLEIVFLLLVALSKCLAGGRAANVALGRGSLEIAIKTREVITWR